MPGNLGPSEHRFACADRNSRSEGRPRPGDESGALNRRIGPGIAGLRRRSRYFTGVSTGAPLFLIRNTTNLAGSVLLAFRPTVCTSWDAFDFHAFFRLDAFRSGKALPCGPK